MPGIIIRFRRVIDKDGNETIKCGPPLGEYMAALAIAALLIGAMHLFDAWPAGLQQAKHLP